MLTISATHAQRAAEYASLTGSRALLIVQQGHTVFEQYQLQTNLGSASVDAIFAAGHGRQRLYILPGLGLVVVRQGEGRYGQERFEDDVFLRALLAD